MSDRSYAPPDGHLCHVDSISECIYTACETRCYVTEKANGTLPRRSRVDSRAAASLPPAHTDLMAVFVSNIAGLNNGAISQIGDHLASQPLAYRARVIERLSSMIGAIADLDATVP